MSDSLDEDRVTIVSLFHDLVLKRSSASVMWGDDPAKCLGLPVPYGCSLEDIQAEAEKAMRQLSRVTGKIAVSLPREAAPRA
jgi:hypothetical protein